MNKLDLQKAEKVKKRKANLVCNAMRTPDGTFLESLHRHDYVSHKDSITGKEYFLDGGLMYIRTNDVDKECESLAVYDDDSHFVIRQVFKWGTFGKDGKGRKVWKKLCDLSDSHISAILKTQHYLPEHRKKLFLRELEFRKSRKVLDEHTELYLQLGLE